MGNENNSMKFKNQTITLAILLILFANVSAFAVSSQYWEENPIKMIPGETKEIEILLQNMAGTEDVYVEGAIIESSEIANMINSENEYLVKAGDKTYIKLSITIPKQNYQSKYNVILSFKTSQEGSGSFGLGNSVEREIPIIIESKPSIIDETSKTWIIAILIIALIVLGILLIKKRGRKGKKRKK